LTRHHIADVERLSDRAFGPARRARTAARVREGAPQFAPTCFAAIDGERLVGAVQCHQVQFLCGSQARRILLLGPLVTDPDRRGEGIGRALMDQAIAAIDAAGLDTTLIGDAPYYGRWGFTSEHTGRWQLPGPFERDRLLLRARNGADWDQPGWLLPPADAERRAADAA
jgi:predicted N-acetyltransferase YhbS